jgi:hypothetical protein
MRYDPSSSVKGVDRCSYTMMELITPPKTIYACMIWPDALSVFIC